jgi:signal transduction histidine kinase
MVKRLSASTYFRIGVDFLRDHPQLWFTAFVALCIVGAFVLTAYRFATIAGDAQEQLINVRVGSILDAFVLFAPDVLSDPGTLRERMAGIAAQNPTIDSFAVVEPSGADQWRVYVATGGVANGAIISEVPIVYTLAASTPSQAFTMPVLASGERHFVTARAIVNSAGAVEALAVTDQGLSEADRLIADNLRTSLYLLGAVLAVIMLLFFRHARLVDYAVLYKKQLEIDELKDSFLSMASHELKSPLTVIRGYIEYLRTGTLSEEERQEFMRRIDLSADELRQLVDDVLDVSRIEMGRLRFSPDYVQPAELIDEVVEMFKVTAEGKGLALSATVPDDVRVLAVRVDRGRMKQVLVNLVSNAVKYTLHGSVTVALARADNERLELSVRDTGVGMTTEEQHKLFEKFYRVEAAETRTVTGTGLGLWITKYIIEHMSGTIGVESIKGQGSRFVVSFPLTVQPKEEGSDGPNTPQQTVP